VWQINAPTTVSFPPNTLMKVGESKDDTIQVLYKHASDFTPRRIAKKHNKDLMHVLNKHNGIFFSLTGLAFALGSIVSSVIFRHDINIYSNDNVTKLCGHIEPISPATGIGRNSNNLALDSDETMEYIDFKTLFFLIQSLRGNVGNKIIVMEYIFQRQRHKIVWTY
jgi:hypothetical protein